MLSLLLFGLLTFYAFFGVFFFFLVAKCGLQLLPSDETLSSSSRAATGDLLSFEKEERRHNVLVTSLLYYFRAPRARAACHVN